MIKRSYQNCWSRDKTENYQNSPYITYTVENKIPSALVDSSPPPSSLSTKSPYCWICWTQTQAPLVLSVMWLATIEHWVNIFVPTQCRTSLLVSSSDCYHLDLLLMLLVKLNKKYPQIVKRQCCCPPSLKLKLILWKFPNQSSNTGCFFYTGPPLKS